MKKFLKSIFLKAINKFESSSSIYGLNSVHLSIQKILSISSVSGETGESRTVWAPVLIWFYCFEAVFATPGRVLLNIMKYIWWYSRYPKGCKLQFHEHREWTEEGLSKANIYTANKGYVTCILTAGSCTKMLIQNYPAPAPLQNHLGTLNTPKSHSKPTELTICGCGRNQSITIF